MGDFQHLLLPASGENYMHFNWLQSWERRLSNMSQDGNIHLLQTQLDLREQPTIITDSNCSWWAHTKSPQTELLTQSCNHERVPIAQLQGRECTVLNSHIFLHESWAMQNSDSASVNVNFDACPRWGPHTHFFHCIYRQGSVFLRSCKAESRFPHNSHCNSTAHYQHWGWCDKNTAIRSN